MTNEAHTPRHSAEDCPEDAVDGDFLSDALYVGPIRLPTNGSPLPLDLRPPFPSDPELTGLTPEKVVRQVCGELRPGEVILVGRKKAGIKDEVKPYTALAMSDDMTATVRQLLVLFEAITEQDYIPFWKLNPYSRAAVEAHSGLRVAEKWNGRQLVTKNGTWSDEHLSRIGFLSGDHDVGRRPEDAKTWEEAIPYVEAVEMYWVKIGMLAAGPTPTLLQNSGRGFSPIWQLDPPIEYSQEAKNDVQVILRELRERAKGLAVDVGIYTSVNPFVKAPGAIHPSTGRTITYAVVGDCELYTLNSFTEYFATSPPWNLTMAPVTIYPDDPVRRKRRKVSDASKASYRRRLGPSYAFIRDLLKLMDYWNCDLSGRSNAFFRSYAWHRRNILMTEVGVEAAKTQESLDEKEYMRRVYAMLRRDMDDLNERTGKRIDAARMNSYLNAKFPKAPMSTSKWADKLKVSSEAVRQLDLTTILPTDERAERVAEHRAGMRRREIERQRKNMALDKMILSDDPYDYSVFTREQVKYRRQQLIEAGMQVPKRQRGRRKRVEDSPLDTPPSQ